MLSCLKRVGFSRSAFRAMLLIVLLLNNSPAFSQDEPSIRTPYVAWSPDGQYIATALDGRVDIIEIATLQILHTFSETGDTRTAPIWSPDGQRIGFGNGLNFEIWSLSSNNPVQEAVYPGDLRGFGAVTASAWSPNGLIVAFSTGNTIDFWDTILNTLVMSYPAGDIGHPWSLDWNSHNNEIAIGGGLLQIFEFQAEVPLTNIYIASYLNRRGSYINPMVRSAVWSPSQDQIAVGSNDAVRVLDLQQFAGAEAALLSHGSGGQFFSGHEGSVFSVDWHPSGKFLASSGSDGTIRIWDVESGQQINIIEFPDNVIVQSVAWSPDGTQLAYGSPTGEPEAVIVPSSELLPLTAEAGPHQTVRAAQETWYYMLRWSADGELLAVATSNGVEIYDETLSLVQTINPGSNRVTYIDWHPDGMQLAVTHDGVEIWTRGEDNLLTFSERLEISGATLGVFWNADGSRVAAFNGADTRESPESERLFPGHRATVVIWNTETWQVVVETTEQYLIPDFQGIYEFDWHPNDPHIFAVAGAQTYIDSTGNRATTPLSAFIINSETGNVEYTFSEVARTDVYGVTWYPDGNSLTTSDEPAVARFSVPSGEFIDGYYVALARNLQWRSDGAYLLADSGLFAAGNPDILVWIPDTVPDTVTTWHPTNDTITVIIDGVPTAYDLTAIPGYVPLVASPTTSADEVTAGDE